MGKISDCVSHYIKHRRNRTQSERAYFAAPTTLVEAIDLTASLQDSNGKRHSHQRRIRSVARDEAARGLHDNIDAIEVARSFDELHNIIGSIIGPVRGIGELTIYDVSLRIGAFLRLEPEVVYLHAGTREGAAALGFSGPLIMKDQLPVEFSVLTPSEIEDCLCIYKGEFSGRRSSFSTCRKPVRRSTCMPLDDKKAGGC